jgi:tRNA 2-thiocytidine biosynthesis protein TtcA
MNAMPDTDTDATIDATAASAAERKLAFEANKLSKRLHRQVGQAVVDFNMIEQGDKVMVCLSGGKDSYALLDILMGLQQRAPIRFELVAVNLDQKQPGFPAQVLPEYLRKLGVPFHIENQDTYSIVKRLVPEGATMCSLCSRLRRGILYRVASELGATKIALGHHRDDIIVTLLMNMFFGGRMKAMPPKLVSDDGRHVVIRPLAYVAETDLERWTRVRRHPIVPCTLCGSQDNLQRAQIKSMLREWEKQQPGRSDNMLRALATVVPSHLLDRNLHPFATLQATGLPDPLGDKAFDEDDGQACGTTAPSTAPAIVTLKPQRETST